VVPSSFYMASAEKRSIRRVVLSGYRLADVLTALSPAASEASTNTGRQSASVSVPEAFAWQKTSYLLHLAAAAASFSHFLTKLFFAAPASFFSPA
jgi:hypothetical protein